MRRLITSAAALVLLAACGGQAPSLPPGVDASPNAGGKWLAINYWAIWCHPCRVEIPELNELAREHSDDMIVYAVNFDDVQGEELLVQAAELGIEFPLLATDPGPELGYARPTVLPTTLLINPAGEVWARLFGPQTLESLEKAMNSEQQILSPVVR